MFRPIFDSVIKILIKKGHQIRIKEHVTVVIISEIEIPIRLREKTKRIRKIKSNYSWNQYDYLPTGNLIFVVEFESWRRKEIADTQFLRLEDKIDQIVDEITRQAIHEKNYRIECEIHQKEAKRRRELEEARVKKINSKLENFKAIFVSKDRWHKANIMRQYLDEYERYFSDKNELDSEKIAWISWARKKADWYDPFIEVEDKFLEGVDRDKLEPIPLKHSWW